MPQSGLRWQVFWLIRFLEFNHFRRRYAVIEVKMLNY